ncbi:MAG: hypothetical protein ACRDGA_10675 [Bacteroidota bacterium]
MHDYHDSIQDGGVFSKSEKEKFPAPVHNRPSEMEGARLTCNRTALLLT